MSEAMPLHKVSGHTKTIFAEQVQEYVTICIIVPEEKEIKLSLLIFLCNFEYFVNVINTETKKNYIMNIQIFFDWLGMS